ncbi:MAG: sugar kinase [Inquilinaceae bacterium]
MKLAAIGECMIEVSRNADGTGFVGFGGDTLNTAVYLARLGVDVTYATALGDDPYSDEMVAAWRDEGVGTGLVARVPGRLPGLYMIRIDAAGERSFHYWRSTAPARDYFTLPGLEERLDRLLAHDALYLSGITLSLYDERGRAVLFELLDRFRADGGQVLFDGNYRPRGWPDVAAARAAFIGMLGRTDMALPSIEDEQALFGDGDAAAMIGRLRGLGVAEIVLKRGSDGCIVASEAGKQTVPTPEVRRPVDTTAAGDSFNAAYIAARLRGATPEAAAHSGHRLAGAVVMHRGAIIPRDAMPAIDAAEPQPGMPAP